MKLELIWQPFFFNCDHLQAKPDSWGFRKFIHMDNLKARPQWLPQDTLTIVCDISIVGKLLFSIFGGVD